MGPPIIDSHIHLYAKHHISSLNWTAGLPHDHVLNRANTVADYKTATTGITHLKGFVFIETDRKSGLADTEWEDSLDEVAFLARVAEGRQPLANEGHEPADSSLVLGVVAWAPIPAGPDDLKKYIDRALHLFSSSSDKRNLIKGFRYLVQDKPRGVALQPAFLQSLCWLGEHNYAFDLGIDARSAGLYQLDEACQMMELLYSTGSATKTVINHLCKPNLRLSAQDIADGHPDFVAWKSYIEKMAGYPHAYMKLSGLFSELPPQDEDHPANITSLLPHITPWASAVFAAFTPSRVMFGSDWPVCNVGGPGIAQSWLHWHSIVTALLDHLGLTPEERVWVWSGTAAKVYNIEQGAAQPATHTS